MNNSKPIKLFVHSKAKHEIDRLLKTHPPNFSYKPEYFYYVLHYISYVKSKDKRKRKSEFVEINTKNLRSVTIFGITRYVKYLEKYDILKCDNIYTPGIKSLAYKINEDLKIGISTFDIPKGSRLEKNMLNRIRKGKSNYSKLPPHLIAMQKKINSLEIDYEKASKYIEDNISNDKAMYWSMSLNHWIDKRFRYFKRSLTNKRLNTNLTNLPKELRQFLKTDAIQRDATNSQPFLLAIALKDIESQTDDFFSHKNDFFFNKHKDNNTPNTPLRSYSSGLVYGDVAVTFGVKALKRISKCRKKAKKGKNTTFSTLLSDTKNGVFYEAYKKAYLKTEKKEITRKEAKIKNYGVLFSRNRINNGHGYIPYKKEKKVFASLYPIEYEMIEILKEKKHNTLAIYLQRLESYLFIDCIAKELHENGIVAYTIHDSIIVDPEYKQSALDIMKSVFKIKLGAVPQFNIEKINEH